ncbi:MAG TPA: hypothetical protein EYP60_08640, partial [bacterium (Candidatus Stahlbacteria)]|nr:hypothetical protein [Candidatus Stahlbacteria bacterium]
MVMTKLRRKMKLFLWFAAAVFIAFIFLQWGMQVTRTRKLTMLERGIVATVNGQPVSYNAYANLLGRYREEGAKGAIESKAFNELIDNVLVENVLKKRGLLLRDEEIIDIIRNNPPPELQNDTMLQTDGEFDYSKYLQVISNPANIRWLMSYENLIRTVVPRQQLYTDVTSTVRLTSVELYKAYVKNRTKVKVSYKVVRPDKFEVALPSDSVVEAFYEAHKDRFKVPSGREIKYVLFEVKPSTDTIEAMERAYELAQNFINIAKEGNFEATAKAKELNIVTTYATQIEDIDLTALLNTYKDKKVVGPIQGDKGFYVIKLGTKVSTYEPSIEEKRKFYLCETKREEARKRAEEIANNFRGGTVTRFFTLKDTLEGIPPGSNFYIDALSLSPGSIKISEPTEVDENFYVIKCLDRKEPEPEKIKEELQEFQANLITNLQNGVYDAW